MVTAREALDGYTVGEEIGRGARSTIYKVVRDNDGEQLAVKFIAVRNAEMDMKVIKHESSNGGRDHYFVVKFPDKREAFLHVDKLSHPVHIKSGDTVGCFAIEDRHATLDEAGTFLLDEIRNKRIEL